MYGVLVVVWSGSASSSLGYAWSWFFLYSGHTSGGFLGVGTCCGEWERRGRHWVVDRRWRLTSPSHLPASSMQSSPHSSFFSSSPPPLPLLPPSRQAPTIVVGRRDWLLVLAHAVRKLSSLTLFNPFGMEKKQNLWYNVYYGRSICFSPPFF
ncbi:hypothetical protein F5I97DRAFT_482206 [Phlebopus sp. FC_14]|nr:hypothetical protein F5I97DRAFT_482206 [Phlebopus sp. FC_14]